MSFMEMPFALVGGAYIIMAAFIVRSLPASVRAGVASLQQIDPSIEEASNILGGDAQYTFRKVTLPLILPALLAGLIFSFTRHMTSLSAIIFLVSAKWRIVTASIMSEWEQGGVSIAAAYSTVIIVFVMLAIFILNLVTNRLFRGRERCGSEPGDVTQFSGEMLCRGLDRSEGKRMYLELKNITKVFPPRGKWLK